MYEMTFQLAILCVYPYFRLRHQTAKGGSGIPNEVPKPEKLAHPPLPGDAL